MFAICAPFVDTYRIYCGYDILIVLPPPIKVEKGGVHDVYHFVFPYFCCGECSCILHLQMAGQKQ